MSTNTSSLQAVQAMLNERGVRDVKFFFSPEMKAMPLSDARGMLAGVLNGYLSADKSTLKKLAPLGDKDMPYPA